MTGNEDCASVLEQFMHDVANLPAEICHMMEEIQAKDSEMQKSLTMINNKDGTLQKHIKLHGSLVPHPKEKEFAESILKNYDVCKEIQDQKIALSDKACLLLERQLKKLDVKIRELQNDGQLQDGPPLPSVFNRKSQNPESIRTFPDLPVPTNLPLQIASANAMNMNAHRVNNQQHISAHPSHGLPRQMSQASAIIHPTARASAPSTPAASLQSQQQRQRESSAGANDLKRRKLNPSFNANIPSQPSALRQSSLGPGTPKAGTPTGTSASRAGSLPRTISTTSNTAAKKSLLSKNVAPHQQISKLKGKPGKHARLSQSRKKRTDSPSHRSRGTTADSDNSLLSSAEPSDTDSQPRSRRGASTSKSNRKSTTIAGVDGHTADVEMLEDEEEGVEEDEQEDDRIYCFCQQKSFGEMVACENDACAYEWFHLTCVGMKKSPDETEIWYCPECREKPEIKVKMEMERKVKKEGGGRK